MSVAEEIAGFARLLFTGEDNVLRDRGTATIDSFRKIEIFSQVT